MKSVKQENFIAKETLFYIFVTTVSLRINLSIL